VAANAAHALGQAVDRHAVNGSLLRLEEVAGLESWWITGETARRFGVDDWRELARRRFNELHQRAGRYTGALDRLAQTQND
jgi:hypothetical protein